MTKILWSPCAKSPNSTLAPEDLREDFIHSLQHHVEVDEPETEVVPALVPSATSDASGDIQFDRMTEEDLLRGLEGLVPPAEIEDECGIASCAVDRQWSEALMQHVSAASLLRVSCRGKSFVVGKRFLRLPKGGGPSIVDRLGRSLF